MKFLVAVSCVLAVAYAKPGIVAPVAYSNVVSHHYATPLAYSAAPVVAAPAVAHAIAAPVVAAPVVQKTQYHAQDAFGQASYGHSEPFQTHNAIQDAAGNKVGSFSYVAPDGQVIAANYVADALGYRVSSNALPVAPAAVPVAPADTVEVAAAKAAHFQAHAIARSRARRSVVAYTAPVVHSAYAYTAPVFRTAAVSTVVNTPAHVAYHVY